MRRQQALISMNLLLPNCGDRDCVDVSINVPKNHSDPNIDSGMDNFFKKAKGEEVATSNVQHNEVEVAAVLELPNNAMEELSKENNTFGKIENGIIPNKTGNRNTIEDMNGVIELCDDDQILWFHYYKYFNFMSIDKTIREFVNNTNQNFYKI